MSSAPDIIVGTITRMLLSYDPGKSERNEALRGLAFSLAQDFDWTTALIVEDTRNDYPEPRYQALGLLGEQLHMLVFTPRGVNRARDQPAKSQPTRKDELCRANRTPS